MTHDTEGETADSRPDGSASPVGHERCCDQDYGGSHYHCGHCGRVSSQMGHYSGMVYRNGFGSRSVKIPGAQMCSREWERQVRAALGKEADAVIARHRKGIPLAEIEVREPSAEGEEQF